MSSASLLNLSTGCPHNRWRNSRHSIPRWWTTSTAVNLQILERSVLCKFLVRKQPDIRQEQERLKAGERQAQVRQRRAPGRGQVFSSASFTPRRTRPTGFPVKVHVSLTWALTILMGNSSSTSSSFSPSDFSQYSHGGMTAYLWQLVRRSNAGLASSAASLQFAARCPLPTLCQGGVQGGMDSCHILKQNLFSPPFPTAPTYWRPMARCSSR